MDEQWVTSVGGPSNSSAPLTPGGQPLKSPSHFPRSHFYTDGSDSGEDSHILGFMGPSSSEDNFNSHEMVESGEESDAGTASRVKPGSSRQSEVEGEIAAFEAAVDDQATVRMSRGSNASNSSEVSSVSSVGPRQASSLGKAPMREDSLGHSVSTAGYQADMSTTLDRVPSSASSSRANTTSTRFDRRPSYQSSSSRRTSTHSPQSRRTSSSHISLREQPIRSSANPTDLSSDDDGTPTISRSSSGVTQRQTRDREILHGEVIVPRWQPDSEVTRCPICNAWFGWLNRKHHCRKCGRVVCNSCSPHRITIPYQYIVQPPDHPSPYNSIAYNRLHDPQGEGRTNTLEFGGGDRVRLCNPCVPDPNVAPPQTNQTGSITEPRHNFGIGYHGRTQSSIVPTTSIPGSLPTESQFPLQDHRPHTVRGQSTSDRSSIAGSSSNPRTAEEFQHWYRERASLSSGQVTRSRSSTVAVAGRDTTEDMRTFLRNFRGPSPSLRNAPDAPTSTAGRPYVVSGEDLRTRPLPRVPQIPEEDECPICHHELPSTSLANAETLRSEHIISCIERTTSRLSTGTPTSTPTPPIPSVTRPALPITQTSTQSNSSRASASSTPVMPPPLPSTPSVGPSQPRRTGVFSYIATEKDCQEDAECQICLEEYEPGLEMGRLECFCKFHLSCIRKWFEKHPGRCPMHQHDEYGY
ncbi:hypothetical protein SBOR_7233 [Sclerotinia borealis F-4128]|uniref:RING-type E3 ubiquitin transferase n=1 Tax=Sclerotinia borealis (strain F-4128) TaxID=1432307 RepID=W9C9B1_SCLBF|nr:hypothetical protein SBOR_7233 [Sclerotinia borealis F-4128]